MKSKLQQTLDQRQQLNPQQLRLAGLLEKTDREIAEEIENELAENPALEIKSGPEPRGPEFGRVMRAAGGAPEREGLPEPSEAAETLGEHLRDQLAELALTPRQRRLALYVIGALDGNGYLTRTIPQLVSDLALEWSGTDLPTPDEVRAAHATVRSLDPPGVGAMDLRDVLLLQLRALPVSRRLRSEALEVVAHYFDIYSRQNFRALAKATGIDEPTLREVHELIRTLNPKPGAAYASDPVQAMGQAGVTPDFIVEAEGERLSVYMPNTLPELQIEESFLADAAMPEAEAFIRDRRSQAGSFIDLLVRRRETLMTIARAIVTHQSAFFLGGDDEALLRPLVLQQVADSTGLDVSTVSRAISGKWLATGLGVYALKHFFNHRGTATRNREEAPSSPAIRAALREIIDSESPSAPLSDEALAAALAARGLPTARRTIAKYRSLMGIPPARLRKK